MSEDATVRELEKRLAEALEQQAATAEILRVISSSPTDVQPVFDVIVRSAVRLCDGLFGSVFRFDGELMHLAAHHNYTPTAHHALLEMLPMQPRLDSPLTAARAIVTRAVVQFEDLEDADTAREYAQHVARAAGFRSGLAVPMLREGHAVGAIFVAREQPGPFSAARIELVKTFADQAVIAIENVRLFNETKEALERETATGEILRVISGSPTNLHPVLEAVAERAARLCSADDVKIHLVDGDTLRLAAQLGPIPSVEARPIIPTRHIGRAVLERRTIHVHDMRIALDEFPDAAADIRTSGARTALATPLLREGMAIGVIQIRRLEVEPFSEKQIALLETFADQAVIAIENVRLFTELQEKNTALTQAHAQVSEALEQQTATSEILRVISSSPTDVEPVFEAVLASGVRLCGAHFGGVFRFDGVLIHLVTSYEWPEEQLEAVRRHFPMPPGDGSLVARAIRDRRVVQTPDYMADARAGAGATLPEWVPLGETGPRSTIAIPMIREGNPLGGIVLARAESGLFSDQHVALLKTFADQAVIAIENVRLFTELQEKNRALTQAHAQVIESLEQQTATAEILRVISSSPTDIQPVFDAIAESARRLCEGDFCNVARYDGKLVHLAAHTETTPEGVKALQAMFPTRPSRGSVFGRAIVEGAVVHIPDISGDAEYSQALGHALGARSGLGVPMLREGRPIGAIAIGRRVARAFTDAQISLLRTFADQAVIAIENVRLFNETREALEQQTATAEILRVISRSPTDVQPVFDTIARNSVTLCAATYAMVYRFDGTLMHLAAHHNVTPAGLEALQRQWPMPPDRRSVPGRAVLDRRVIHIHDVLTEPDSPYLLTSRALGIRTMLVVPMLRDGEPIGAIAVYRQDVEPFADTQVALVATFADQAVIAIENVRLFTELQEKNRALTDAHARVTESLERQTATSEILRVISSTHADAQPVFDTIVRSAGRLCNATIAAVYLTDGRMLYHGAIYGGSPEALAAMRARYPQPLDMSTTAGMAILTRSLVHVPDVEEPSAVEFVRQSGRILGFRSVVTVPMRREGEPVGVIIVARLEPGCFSDAEVDLLKTFADQAVIAIENVRLFKELETRNRDLTATSEILRVIARSPTDLQPVFDTIAERAMGLWPGAFGGVLMFDGELIHLSAVANVRPEGVDALRRAFPMAPSRASTAGRAILTGDVVEIPDVLADPEYELTDPAQAANYRGTLAVPMLHHGRAIGVITVTRREPGPFSQEQIQLLKTFADQAVIAIENVRLFTELRERTAQLGRSVEELTALGEVSQALSSTLDLETVLTTIVQRAIELSAADGGSVYEYDDVAEEFRLRATQNFEEELVEASRALPLRRGEGALGMVAERREPVQIADISDPAAYQSRVRDVLLRTGYRAILGVPLLRDDRIVGALVIGRKTAGDFSSGVIALLKTFANQSALAIQNARLFRELADKSKELEAASQHKSEFLANMSHELRTPLNAVIGFSEVLSERMFGDLNEKQEEYLKDIHASGQHLLSLINDILDLSKIEAGRMELEVTEFDLPMAIENAMTLIRGRAARRSIALHTTVDERLGQIQGDERKIRQVLLNLLSNAIKFTPEGGLIGVHAVPRNGMIEVSVTDTGVGIAPEDQEAVFEEFKQVGTADKKVEGTGLGLALSRKFIELHGGKIWVKSQVGQGSTFTFTVPVRRGE